MQDKIRAFLVFPKPNKVKTAQSWTALFRAFNSHWQPSANVKTLRRFLGMVNFQRKFIPNASEIIQPLNDFLK